MRVSRLSGCREFVPIPLCKCWRIGALWGPRGPWAYGPHGPHGPLGPLGVHRPLWGPWGPRGPWGPLAHGAHGAQGAQGAQGAHGALGALGPMGPRLRNGVGVREQTRNAHIQQELVYSSHFLIWSRPNPGGGVYIWCPHVAPKLHPPVE